MRPSRAAAARARHSLTSHGLTDVLYALTPGPHGLQLPRNDRFETVLREIAGYIGSNDPLDIAAAAILEASGYERSQLQLILSDD